ncbi:MAG: carbonic anhydrase [Alphaproteobacteria bacterium]
MSAFEEVSARNAKWIGEKLAGDPDYFTKLASGQSPDFFIIACSDSRVSLLKHAGLDLGEEFSTRNIANLATPDDTSFMASLRYAVEHLKVKHVVVCGHSSCGGLTAALKGVAHDEIADWLKPVDKLIERKQDELSKHADVAERVNCLAHLNVEEQVQNIYNSPVLEAARARGQEVKVHGWYLDLSTGRVTDTGVSA